MMKADDVTGGHLYTASCFGQMKCLRRRLDGVSGSRSSHRFD